VWKRLDYNGLFRMNDSSGSGVDVGTLCTEANIKPAYLPCFVEYHRGTVRAVAFRRFVSNLINPTAAQLPANGVVRARSDGPDGRVVTIRGLVVAADNTVSAGAESISLNGTTNVVGTTKFQRIDSASLSADPARTVNVEEGSIPNRAIGAIAP